MTEEAVARKAGAAPPSHEQVVGNKATAVLALQRAVGNRAVSRAMEVQAIGSPAGGVHVQRHADGDPMLATKVEEDPVLSEPSKGPQDSIFSRMAKALGMGAAKAPVTVLAGSLDVAVSQKALQDAFGTAAGRTIVKGTITTVSGHAAVCAAYDAWCIAHKVPHPTTGEPWKDGDKLAINKAQGVRTNAFAEPPPGTGIWVDVTSKDPTATMHEMLHINTAADYKKKMGRVINEGVTQRLAKKAAVASGFSIKGSEGVYAAEQDIVQRIVDVVGESCVIDAYFGGADTLITALDTALGEGMFSTIKAFLDKDNYKAAKPLIVKAKAKK